MTRKRQAMESQTIRMQRRPTTMDEEVEELEKRHVAKTEKYSWRHKT